MLDKGYKQFFGNLQSFLDILSAKEDAVGGRSRHIVPADTRDNWLDQLGNSHPPPATPVNLPRGKLLWEVQANSTRTYVTSFRWTVEACFARDWGWAMTGSRGEIPQQLLGTYNKQPTPQAPKIFVRNAAHHQIMSDFATPISEAYELPNNVTYEDIGKQMAERIELLNWLDSFRTGSPSPFHRSNIFSKPTIRDRQLGLLGNPGGVTLVNCLDPNETGFPAVLPAEFTEFCTGPYLSGIARSYVSLYRVKELERSNQQYVNLAHYHQSRSQLSLNIEGWYFDQMEPPLNWNGVWPGANHPNQNPWQPVRILTIPHIPSRYTSNVSHTVVLAYVPNAWPLLFPARGYKSNSLHRIQMFICGPRVPGKCKVGARTASPCAHVAAGVYICGVLGHNPGLFKTTWRQINYVDAAQDLSHTNDVLSGLVS